jgi:hypothetical protein
MVTELTRIMVRQRNPNLRHEDVRAMPRLVDNTQPLNGCWVTLATAFATRRAVRQVVPVSMMSRGVLPSPRMSPHWRVVADGGAARAETPGTATVAALAASAIAATVELRRAR